jgi:hypothetical protein
MRAPLTEEELKQREAWYDMMMGPGKFCGIFKAV